MSLKDNGCYGIVGIGQINNSSQVIKVGETNKGGNSNEVRTMNLRA